MNKMSPEERLARRLMLSANGGSRIGMLFWFAADNPLRDLLIQQLSAKAREIEDQLVPDNVLEYFLEDDDPKAAFRELFSATLKEFVGLKRGEG